MPSCALSYDVELLGLIGFCERSEMMTSKTVVGDAAERCMGDNATGGPVREVCRLGDTAAGAPGITS